MDPVIIPVSAKRWAAVIGLVVAVLVSASMGSTALTFLPIQNSFLREVRESIVRLTWVDGEGNIPTWFSASLLLCCALLLALIALAHQQARFGPVAGWLGLSFIFLFLSLDETAQFHELLISPLRLAFNPTGFLYYAWIIPAGICLAILVLAYSRFLLRLPARTRRLFLLAGMIYVGGALGVEAVSGMQAFLHGEQNLTYHLIITVEELLEMAGIAVFVYALLDYISRHFSTIHIQVTSR